jgi:ParB family chromosome partitioning protein
MLHHSALGKGLDALLPVEGDEEGVTEAVHEVFAPKQAAETGSGVMELALEDIRPDPNQPRKDFDPEELEELAASIKKHGVIEPIIVEEGAETGAEGRKYWTIIAGERRFRASKLAGLEKIPALVRNYRDDEKAEVTLIENIQRSDLNSVEEARAYQRLMQMNGYSQEELAEKVGKNRATVANALRLLRLAPAMLSALEKGPEREGGISAGHGRALLAVEDEANRALLFDEIRTKSLSVRAAEARAQALNGLQQAQGPGAGTGDGGEQPGSSNLPEAAGSQKVRRPPELDAMEEKFLTRLGTKVAIDGGMNAGRIIIDYYSMEDLERLYEILGGDESL